MIGTTIGHYKIESKLGEGGMGVVYRALDTKLNRPVALKFLPSHVSEAEKDKERFVQEAQAAASLSHANICTIYGIEEQESPSTSLGTVQFIVMEYVDGQTLQEKKQNLPLKQALEIGIQIADGLAAAHDKGIVHRDIKPENIMIKKDGTVQIMDFGLAKLRGATRLTKEGSTVGTVGYMSPEQVQGLDVDHRTDIFSLGVLLYEMIAGQSPFKGVHETAIIYEIVNVDPPPIGTIKPEIDAELDAVVLDCVAKDPADRYQSAAEVARNLRRVKRESSRSRVSRITGSRAAYRMPETEPVHQQSARRMATIPWIVAGAFAVIALVLTFFAFAASEGPQSEIRLSVLPPDGSFFSRRAGGSLAISPDGSMIAFVGVDSTRTGHLYVRALNDATPRQLPGTEGAMRPFWSPDSRWIGFETARTLKKIDVMGGSPLTVCALNASQGATWNSSGQILYNGYEASSGLWVIRANGGESKPLVDADTATIANSGKSSRWPWFLPDGEHFLFTELTPVGNIQDGSIMVGSLSSSERKELVRARSNAQYADGHIFFYRDNKLIAQPFDPSALELTGDPIPLTENPTYNAARGRADFSVSNDGTVVQTTGWSADDASSSSTVWLDRAGRPADGPDVRGDLRGIRISPDGSQLALEQADGGQASDIWVYSLRRNVRSRLTFGEGVENSPVWSPDGRTVYFTAGLFTGQVVLSRKNAVGVGTEEEVHTPAGRERVADISPDGRYLFYLLSPMGNPIDDIYALPLQGERTPIPVVTDKFDQDPPAVSPDGRWLAYASNETGMLQIYIVPFPATGSRWQISSGKENAISPRWRRDGKELFYTSGGDILSVPIETKAGVLLPGTPSVMFEAPNRGGYWNWDVTPDGKKFVFIQSLAPPELVNAPALVVLNWKREK